ncbi:hypothetical protein [Persicobacter psychrovividus]|uniref:hypothetical protein n=1 Tax=Persicobacter psychrovividus TaxID=387638 RepID=UPI0030CA14E6
MSLPQAYILWAVLQAKLNHHTLAFPTKSDSFIYPSIKNHVREASSNIVTTYGQNLNKKEVMSYGCGQVRVHYTTDAPRKLRFTFKVEDNMLPEDSPMCNTGFAGSK